MTHPSLKHPGRWVWLILLVPVVLGLARLRFDVEVFDLLPHDLEVVQGLKLYQQYFSNARQLIITVRAAEAEQAETASKKIAEALRAHPDMVASVNWQAPWMEHPEQMAELIGYLWFNQPPAIFGSLSNQLSPEQLPKTFAAAREELATSLSPDEIARLSYDPLGLTRLPEGTAGAGSMFGQGQELFSSSDGRFRIIFVQAVSELRGYRECERWLAAVESMARASVGNPPAGGGLDLAFTGRPAFVAEVAGGMEHDTTMSVGGTAVIIAVLFWIAHRRLKPMLWLLALLAAILGCTLALGGLIYGSINVVSTGFAAILLGLAVDYAVVHYQEALAEPHLSIAQIRHAIAPSIFWAAATTITAFLMLNFGGLPGLGQLGTLVGLGVALSALIMIFEFLPPLFPERNTPAATQPAESAPSVQAIASRPSRRPAWVFTLTTLSVILPLGLLLAVGAPPVDPTANALRPRNSSAYTALEQVQALLSQQKEPLWLIIGGTNESEVAHRLAAVDDVLTDALNQGTLSAFMLPTGLWPRPAYQAQNRSTAGFLASEGQSIRQAAEAAGFAERSIQLTEGVLHTWAAAGAKTPPFWPTNQLSQWILEKFTSRSSSNKFALGVIHPKESGPPANLEIKQVETQLPHNQVWLSGWELLGHAIFSRVKANLWKVVTPMIVLVLLSLWLAFRRFTEILLSLAVLLASGLCLLSAMRLAGWSWNLLNLMAIPLILGTGVDYSIFMQLALRRYRGDARTAHRAVGRALLLCGGTAIAGFGSLAWSSNAGMASLGRVCAIGIGGNMLMAVFLLPTWWQAAVRPQNH
jgi:predicted RND superfamily exporter protein